MDETKLPAPPEAAAPPAPADQALAPAGGAVPSIWNDSKLLAQTYKAASFLAKSELVPQATYRNKPENCLIALDLANRMNLSPLLVMQNLYIVKGHPGWSGQFCITAVNACGRFTPLEFVETDNGCFARARRIPGGQLCTGTEITWAMVKSEGWLDKPGSKWKTMPGQMMKYRAASFFVRAFCPELLSGIQTIEEVQDVNGYASDPPPVVEIVLEE